MLKREIVVPPEHLYPPDEWRVIEARYSEEAAPPVCGALGAAPPIVGGVIRPTLIRCCEAVLAGSL